jgi:hypothetical protein
VLPGASATQIDVVAPAALLTTPGTYRLTVVDPVRRVGDAFVVASQAVSIVGAGGMDAPGAQADPHAARLCRKQQQAREFHDQKRKRYRQRNRDLDPGVHHRIRSRRGHGGMVPAKSRVESHAD